MERPASKCARSIRFADAIHYTFECVCSQQEVHCEVCNDRQTIDCERIGEIFRVLFDCELCSEWLQTAYSHAIWKLSAYGSIAVTTLLLCLKKRHSKEQSTQSFFLKVAQKDETCSRHFVGLIASVNLSKSKLSVLVSDGCYTLPYEAEVSGDLETTEGKVA